MGWSSAGSSVPVKPFEKTRRYRNFLATLHHGFSFFLLFACNAEFVLTIFGITAAHKTKQITEGGTN